MYKNPIVQENINKLKKLGYDFISPSSGRLACGDIGEGKLADTNLISNIAASKLYDLKDMKNKKVLITAGPTIAPIDPVRYITNRSTGKMGYALAEEARDRGADVTLVSGPTNISPPYGVNFVTVKTNQDMYEKVLELFPQQDIVIKSAAVADYKPETYSPKKIKKKDSSLVLSLIKDNDILKKLGEIKRHQLLIGFAAESNDLIENAKSKLINKNLDFIVANDISGTDVGFASDENKVIILNKNGTSKQLDKMPKRLVARELFNFINS
jgi:phosphopantothenoylcysteine decarboxylase/phosphopantothenate--cysteine ligase